MRYSVTYGRKVRTGPYETMEISINMEFDERTDPHDAFRRLRELVEYWISHERNRLLEEAERDKGN